MRIRMMCGFQQSATSSQLGSLPHHAGLLPVIHPHLHVPLTADGS